MEHSWPVLVVESGLILVPTVVESLLHAAYSWYQRVVLRFLAPLVLVTVLNHVVLKPLLTHKHVVLGSLLFAAQELWCLLGIS